MKITKICFLAAVAALIGWHAGAQTYKAPPCYMAVNGKIYDVNNSQLWMRMDGDIVKILTNGIVVETFTAETKQQAVVEQHPTQGAFGFTGRYHSETKMVDVGKEKVPGKKIIIRNYPLGENTAVGKTILIFAMQTGTLEYNGDRLELWDLGTYPPESFFRELKADADEQQKAAKKAIQDKKEAAEARALNYNQDAADKGDAYGLMRMGERYRDGDGVEKDLAKAKDYLTKAVAAGSPTAADELSKLNGE